MVTEEGLSGRQKYLDCFGQTLITRQEDGSYAGSGKAQAGPQMTWMSGEDSGAPLCF